MHTDCGCHSGRGQPEHPARAGVGRLGQDLGGKRPTAAGPVIPRTGRRADIVRETFEDLAQASRRGRAPFLSALHHDGGLQRRGEIPLAKPSCGCGKVWDALFHVLQGAVEERDGVVRREESNVTRGQDDAPIERDRCSRPEPRRNRQAADPATQAWRWDGGR